MNVDIYEEQGVSIVHLSGNLDTNTSPPVEAKISNLLEEGTRKMVIDLSETDYVSSAGLRIFLATAKKITANGGAVKLAGPNSVVKEILDISGFSTILDVRPDRADAIQALNA
ncbi:MAG: STAS domain-containing protein [Flavobacteriales bacterium]|nr:STAS domain-containing protein [Flavobacteriales bacterium]